MKIGYLGPDGTFSQLAAHKYAGADNDFAAYVSIQGLVAAANDGSVDSAIVPIENSLEGGVNTTLDCLAFDYDLTIVNELLLEVHQCFLSNAEAVRMIYSHPQPAGQCARFLAKRYPSVPVTFTVSTAAAAIAAKEPGGAAIGGEALAEIYGLAVKERGIEDVQTNMTRFVVVRKKEDAPAVSASAGYKTSIVFSVEDKPGALYKMLSVFDIFGINMIKIESRPAKTALGIYMFFVDLEGSPVNADLARALELVQYKSTFFKQLGSYRSADA